ncbi:MAG TPA: hypothetical protein VIT44_10640 [Cyclobacteriaceae bacterium]
MKKKIFGLIGAYCLVFSLNAQDGSKDYRNFPIIVTLQFHCFSLPFRDIKSNFSNVGIGVGTEVSYSGRQNWVQQVSALWYHNKAMGNGLLLYSQAVWRPTIQSDFYTEVKTGAGYLLSFRPTKSFELSDGKWIAAGRKGKGMLALPVGVSVGNNLYSSGTTISPFISYQFLLVSGMNKSIPVVPETLIQAGMRIHPAK